MRRLAFVLLLFVCAAAQAAELAFPPLTGRVVDQAAILSASAAQDLAAKLQAHEQATGHQVVVATIASLEGRDIAEYGVELGRAWGIGQKDKSNGAILLVAPNDRAVRIEVGYGLEGQLTDARSRLIIENNILPAFRAGRMEAGVVAGVEAILAVLRGDPDAVAQPPVHTSDPGGIPIITILIIVFVLTRMFRKRMGLWPLVLGAPTVWHGGRSRRGGGFGGSGRSGGGFRGGGGSFGGGGASGRW